MLKKLLVVSVLSASLMSVNSFASCATASFIPKLVVHAARTQDLYGQHWYQIQNDTPSPQTYDVCFNTKFGNQPNTEKYESNECKRVVLQSGENSGRVEFDQWVYNTYWQKAAAGGYLRAEASTKIQGECNMDGKANTYTESLIKVKDY